MSHRSTAISCTITAWPTIPRPTRNTRTGQSPTSAPIRRRLFPRWGAHMTRGYNPTSPLPERRFVEPRGLLTSLFFLWAFGVNLNDSLNQPFKKAVGLTDSGASLIQGAFPGGYRLAALP